MPYRIDVRNAGGDALDRLIDIGALDVDASGDDGVVALMPDQVTPAEVAQALGVQDVSVSPATGRDDGSVWVLKLRAVRVRGRTLELLDAAAFGTGLHPTTRLCLEALEASVEMAVPDAVLDVGTGSGVLALAALMLGVPHAMGLDLDDEALRIAAENAHVNGLSDRLSLTKGGPESVTAAWPLVVANILPATLIEMAPTLVRRVAHHGELVLSGIPTGVDAEVDRAYRRLGMHLVGRTSRSGWVALILRASW